MARTRKRKTSKKSKSPRSQTSIAGISRSEAIQRGIRAIMRMRNENNTNNMPPEYLKNVENMMKRRGLNEHGSPIFYDALSSHQQNENNNSESDYESARSSPSTNNNENSFMVVGKKGKRKTKKQGEQKRSNTKKKSPKSSPNKKASHIPASPQRTSPPRSAAAAEERENVKQITLPSSYKNKILEQHESLSKQKTNAPSFSRLLKSTSVPNYKSFWSNYAKEAEFVELKKYIQAIIQHDIERFSTQSSHVSTPWISGNIAKKVFGSHFHLSLRNKPENIVDFKTGQVIGMTQDLPYDYNVSQIIISILSLLVGWINKKLFNSRRCNYMIMTKGGRVIQYFGHDYDSFDLDLLIVPKSILKKTNTDSLLQDYDVSHTRKMAHEILILLQWFCEMKDKVDLSIMTPDHDRAINKSIFKLSMVKSQSERLGKIRPLIDLGFTWISSNGNNHTNTLPFFIEPIMMNYDLSLLPNMNLEVLCVHQNKQQYKNEKTYILEKESKKLGPNREEKTITKMRKQLKMLS